MTFAPIETSRTKGAPVFTYLFEWGEEETSRFAYVNAREDITLDAITYTAIPIRHDKLTTSGSLDKTNLKITAKRDISIRSLFLIWPPSSVVNLTIRQGHADDLDGEFIVCWSGRVLSFERDGSEAVLTCQPIATSMRRPNLRRFYQHQCPHLLYSIACGADRVARTVTTTVETLVPSTHSIIVPSGWNDTIPTAKFRQGEIRWIDSYGETQIRTILAVSSGIALRLSGPLIDLVVSQSVDVAAGCNHLTSPIGVGAGDCTNLHENGPNFGGCKWIPKKNPTGFRNGWY